MTALWKLCGRFISCAMEAMRSPIESLCVLCWGFCTNPVRASWGCCESAVGLLWGLYGGSCTRSLWAFYRGLVCDLCGAYDGVLVVVWKLNGSSVEALWKLYGDPMGAQCGFGSGSTGGLREPYGGCLDAACKRCEGGMATFLRIVRELKGNHGGCFTEALLQSNGASAEAHVGCIKALWVLYASPMGAFMKAQWKFYQTLRQQYGSIKEAKWKSQWGPCRISMSCR